MNDTATPQLSEASKAVVRFRIDRFDAFAEHLGHVSNVKKARLVGCGVATMSRMRAGKQNPGPQFIAAVYAAAQQHGVDGAGFFDFAGTGN